MESSCSYNILSTGDVSNEVKNALKYTSNIAIDFQNFIQINYLDDSQLINQLQSSAQQKMAVIFTSQHAVKSIAKQITKVPKWTAVYCMEGTTATSIAEAFDNANIEATGVSAVELANKMIADEVKEAIFYCGNKRLVNLPSLLQNAGINLKEYVVYETVETPHKIEKDYNGIVFYSPSGVHSFFSLNEISEATNLFAIGNTTAEAIKKYTNNTVAISEVNDKQFILQKAIETIIKEQQDNDTK